MQYGDCISVVLITGILNIKSKGRVRDQPGLAVPEALFNVCMYTWSFENRVSKNINRCHFSLEIFKLNELQRKSAWLRLT